MAAGGSGPFDSQTRSRLRPGSGEQAGTASGADAEDGQTHGSAPTEERARGGEEKRRRAAALHNRLARMLRTGGHMGPPLRRNEQKAGMKSGVEPLHSTTGRRG